MQIDDVCLAIRKHRRVRSEMRCLAGNTCMTCLQDGEVPQ